MTWSGLRSSGVLTGAYTLVYVTRQYSRASLSDTRHTNFYVIASGCVNIHTSFYATISGCYRIRRVFISSLQADIRFCNLLLLNKDFSGNKVIHHHHCGRTDFGDHIVDTEKIGSQPHTQFVHPQSYNTQQDKDYELAAFIGIFIGLKYKRNT